MNVDEELFRIQIPNCQFKGLIWDQTCIPLLIIKVIPRQFVNYVCSAIE